MDFNWNSVLIVVRAEAERSSGSIFYPYAPHHPLWSVFHKKYRIGRDRRKKECQK